MIDKKELLNFFGLLLVVTGSTLIIHADCQQHGCEFPEQWRGTWYQSGLGQIYINGNSMSEKGHCVQHYTDYYIIEKKDRQCIMCLLMLERHENIIQYKESYCVTSHNMQTVCSLIQVEGVMYTLVKENSVPMRCPFHGNYQIDYKDYTHSYCDDTKSRLQTCTDTDVLRFKFQHCDSATVLHDADVEFECVATWKEGSEQLVYGRFSGPTIASKHDSYRCFKYEKRGYDINLSMSADATCRGLITPELGPVTMKLHRDVDTVRSDCSYPHWLSSKKWIDINREYRLNVHKQKLTLHTVHSRRAVSHLSCYDINHGDDVGYFISGYFNRDKCYKNYNCLHITEVHRSVFIFYVGVIYPTPVTAEQCKQKIPDKSSQHVFMESGLQTTNDKCPLTGRYTLPTEINNCQMVIHVGCNNQNTIKVHSLCHNFTDSVLVFKCKSYWSEGDSTALLLSDFEDNIMCLNIKERQKTIRIKRCKKPSQFYPSIRLYDNLHITKKGACPKDAPDQSSVNTVDENHNDKKQTHKTRKPPDDREVNKYISSNRPISEELVMSRTSTTTQTVKLYSQVVKQQTKTADRTTTAATSVKADNLYLSSSSSSSSSSAAYQFTNYITVSLLSCFISVVVFG